MSKVFENNLEVINKPVITKSSKNYTKITYYPDFKKFNIPDDKISDDFKKIFLKRIIDISVYCSKLNVKTSSRRWEKNGLIKTILFFKL